MNWRIRKSGFTLVELVIVVVVLAVVSGVIFTVLGTNWSAYDDQNVRSDLLLDANEILESITDQARAAGGFSLEGGTTKKSVSILDEAGNMLVRYDVDKRGNSADLKMTHDGANFTLLSDHVDFDKTIFAVTGSTLTITLALKEDTFKRPIETIVRTEIYSRN